MTAFLKLDRLRATALPVGPAVLFRLPETTRTRPALTATWHVGEDGRLICRWDTDDPKGPRAPR